MSLAQEDHRLRVPNQAEESRFYLSGSFREINVLVMLSLFGSLNFTGHPLVRSDNRLSSKEGLRSLLHLRSSIFATSPRRLWQHLQSANQQARACGCIYKLSQGHRSSIFATAFQLRQCLKEGQETIHLRVAPTTG